ncbi:OsmC family protein [Granulosicoccus sp. 3-233]|uniref:OsmC family protein n=1 Tax=Granulosicoccus sp. 3-233 TaxID=3417969 RepID=UPI003D3503C7
MPTPKSDSPRQHDYTARIEWTGNTGQGTSSYHAYQRSWDISTPGKPTVHCSNDPLLGGDPDRHNPEDLLLTTVSACHMLWYLHLASNQGIVVQGYVDNPVGVGETSPNGAGRFLSATLHPRIRLSAGSDCQQADAVHGLIHQYCFIARSLNFPVHVDASYELAADL